MQMQSPCEKKSSATAGIADRGRKADLNLKLHISNSGKPAKSFLSPMLHSKDVSLFVGESGTSHSLQK